jgi:uncharacterized protein YjiS (DUF1127 family)
MEIISNPASVAPRFDFVSRIVNAVSGLAHYFRMQSELSQVLDMSDSQLKDIGISRDEVRRQQWLLRKRHLF